MKKMTIIIDVDSERGLCLAITLFIEHCSENMIPKECDRTQLIYNVESYFNDMDKRSKILNKYLGKGEEKNEKKIL